MSAATAKMRCSACDTTNVCYMKTKPTVTTPVRTSFECEYCDSVNYVLVSKRPGQAIVDAKFIDIKLSKRGAEIAVARLDRQRAIDAEEKENV